MTKISGVKKVGKYKMNRGMAVERRWEKTCKSLAANRATTVNE
jgi:hypothetical protein